MKNNIVLGIDTTGEYCSVGLINGENMIAEISEKTPQEHSLKLIPFIDKLLKDNSLKIQDINAIAVSIGPGSFTGLKVGVAIAKTLSQALGIPIVGIPTLDATALNVIDARCQMQDAREGIICVITDARKSQVYTAIYKELEQNKSTSQQVNKLKKLTKDSVMTVDELLSVVGCRSSVVFVGNGIKIYKDKIEAKLKDKVIFTEEKYWHPKAGNIALEGWKKLQNNKKGDNLFKLNPVYVRQPDIWKK